MNVEQVNRLHATTLEAEAAMDELSGTCDETSEACEGIEDPRSSLWHAWSDYIVKTGDALRVSRQQHGSHWEKVYDSLGYDFSYQVACQYIVCARYQDAADFHDTFEQWAAVAAEYELVDQVNQAAGVTSEPYEAWERADRTDWTDHSYSLLAIFDRLDLAICNLPQYATLKKRWEVLADGIRNGELPAPGEDLTDHDDDDDEAPYSAQATTSCGAVHEPDQSYASV